MVQTSIPKAAPGDTTSLAARYERAKQLQQEKEGGAKKPVLGQDGKPKSAMVRLNEVKKERFGTELIWVLGVFVWFL